MIITVDLTLFIADGKIENTFSITNDKYVNFSTAMLIYIYICRIINMYQIHLIYIYDIYMIYTYDTCICRYTM